MFLSRNVPRTLATNNNPPHGTVNNRTQMFAVEVFDNAANLAAVFYTVDAIPRYGHPRPRPKSNTPRLLMGPAHSGNNCHSLNGSFGGSGGGSFGGTDSAGRGHRIRR